MLQSMPKKKRLNIQWIDLSIWLPANCRMTFEETIDRQQQTLIIDLESNLPEFKSDLSIVIASS